MGFTLTAVMIWELVKLIAIPLALALAGWVYKINIQLHDVKRDIKEHHNDDERRFAAVEKEIDRLTADGKQRQAAIDTINQGQQQIMVTLARLETQLQNLQKMLEKEGR